MGCLRRRLAQPLGITGAHTPDVPESLEGVIEEAVVEEPEVSMKETEYLKADNKTYSLRTTIATDGHSVGPPSISHCDPLSPSSNEDCADTDVAAALALQLLDREQGPRAEQAA